MANLFTLLDPSRLVPGGGVLLGSPDLPRIVRTHLSDETIRAARQGLGVELAGLGGDAGAVGAALLPRRPGDPNAQ